MTPRGCELNVAHHCNLACRSCSHLSPVFKKHLADPAVVARDFATLAKHYRPQFVKLLGGEPLLHPVLTEVIDAVRASDICDWIQVCTNGLWLPRMTGEFWRRVDEVLVSVYPGAELDEDELAEVEHAAEAHGVELGVYHYDYFRESYSAAGTDDAGLVQRLYASCQVAHVWRCHTVEDGFFFKCPQSVFIPRTLATGSPPDNGVAIDDGPDFGRRLLEYLDSRDPLPACRNCLANAGRLFPHEQANRRTWHEAQQAPTEELLDLPFLLELEEDPAADDSCCREDAERWARDHPARVARRRELRRLAERGADVASTAVQA